MIWVQIDESQIGFYQKNNFGLPVREDRCLFLRNPALLIFIIQFPNQFLNLAQ